MPKSNPMSGKESTRLQERVLHPRHLLLHRLQGLADRGWAHLLGAQVAYFLDLQEIKKRITLSGGYQFGFFPTRQLTRREPQDAKQVRSTISVHGYMGVATFIIGISAL
jgi:hypothetical protein